MRGLPIMLAGMLLTTGAAFAQVPTEAQKTRIAETLQEALRDNGLEGYVIRRVEIAAENAPLPKHRNIPPLPGCIELCGPWGCFWSCPDEVM